MALLETEVPPKGSARKSEMIPSLASGLRIAKSRIDGRGCFAAACFSQDQLIAEYVGERITFAEAERRQQALGKKCVCDIDKEWSIDGSLGGNGTQYINHSCDPNAYLVISRGRLFLHALREITPAEEITAEYLYELELDERTCRCQTAACVENQRPRKVAQQTIDGRADGPAPARNTAGRVSDGRVRARRRSQLESETTRGADQDRSS